MVKSTKRKKNNLCDLWQGPPKLSTQRLSTC